MHHLHDDHRIPELAFWTSYHCVHAVTGVLCKVCRQHSTGQAPWSRSAQTTVIYMHACSEAGGMSVSNFLRLLSLVVHVGQAALATAAPRHLSAQPMQVALA